MNTAQSQLISTRLPHLIPVLVAFGQGGRYARTYVNPTDFRMWRNETAPWVFIRYINLYTWFGIINMKPEIIITMNGFVYDRVHQHHTGQLLRERMTFDFDINAIRKF